MGAPSILPSPLTQVILATDMWAAFTVETLPSLLSSASSWFRVTNSASMATRSPFLGNSSCPRGVKVVRFTRWTTFLSSAKISTVMGFLYSRSASDLGTSLAEKLRMQGIFHFKLNQVASCCGIGVMVKSLKMYHWETGDPILAW